MYRVDLWRALPGSRLLSLVILTLISFGRSSVAQLIPGQLDTNFTANAPAQSYVFNVLSTPDGRLLLASDAFPSGLGLLQADGHLDHSFLALPGYGSSIQGLAIDSSGRFLAARTGQSDPYVVRFTANGSFDTSFQAPSFSGGNFVTTPIDAILDCVFVQPDGQILVGGAFWAAGGVLQDGIVRLQSNGALDTGFRPRLLSLQPYYIYTNGLVTACFSLANGRVVIAGNIVSAEDSTYNGLLRVNADGSLDRSFHVTLSDFFPSGVRGISALAVQPDGRMIIGGNFGSINGTVRNNVARLLSDGTVDPSFDPGLGPDGAVTAIVVQEHGRIVIGGQFTQVAGQPSGHIARLTTEGTLDLSFLAQPGLTGDYVEIKALAVTPDDSVVVGGRFTSTHGTPVPALAKLVGAEQLPQAPVILQQPSDQIVMAGQTATLATQVLSDAPVSFQWTFNDKALLDATNMSLTFSSPTITNSGTYQLLVQNSFGSTLSDPVHLTVTDPLTTPGALDLSFKLGSGPDGPVSKVVAQPDGRILIGGLFTNVNGSARRALARINSDGQIDSTFQSRFGVDAGAISFLATQPDGRILVGGDFTSYDSVGRPGAVRLNSDGSLDASFNPPASVRGLTVLYPDDRCVPISPLLRLNANGSPDMTFAPPSVFFSSSNPIFFAGVRKATVTSDGGLTLLAAFNIFAPGSIDSETRLYRLQPDGSLDPSFTPAVLGMTADLSGHRDGLAAQPDGRWLVLRAGTVVRYQTDGSPDSTFTSPVIDFPIQALAVQPDGKIVIGGLFKNISGITRRGLARLNSNGSLDLAFNPGLGLDSSELTSPILEFVSDISLQADGGILIGGDFLTVNGQRHLYLARLRGGELEGPPSIPVPPTSRTVMAEQTITLSAVAAGTPSPTYQWLYNEKIIVGATNASLVLASVSNAQEGSYTVTASNLHGTVESSPAILTVVPAEAPIILTQPIGATASEGANLALSVTATNLLPLSYQWQFNGKELAGATNRTLALQNLALTMAGTYAVVVRSEVRSVTSADAVVTVQPSQSVDVSFLLPRLPWDYDARSVRSLVAQPDGKIVVVGDFARLGGMPRNHIARLNADGSVDSSFDPGTGVGGGYFTGSPLNYTYLDIQAVALQADGKVLIGGRFTLLNGNPRAGIARLNADGSEDESFVASGVTEGPFDPVTIFSPTLAYVSSIVVQPDGRILIAGPFHKVNGAARNCVARLNVDGSLDSSFDPGLGLTNASGLLFNATYLIGLQRDGEVIVLGNFDRAYREDIVRSGMARFSPDGVLDLSFNPAIEPATWASQPHSLALTADGKIAFSGAFTNVNDVSRSQLARLNSDGTLDARFNPARVPDVPVGLLAESNGALILFGAFTNIEGVARAGIARLNVDRTVDLTFDPGSGPAPGGITAAEKLPSGEILVAGNFTDFDGAARDGFASLYGYDPSVPRLITPVLSDGTIRLSLRTRPGKIYHLEAADTLVRPVWKTIQVLTGDGSIQQTLETPAQATGYFRAWTE